MRTIGRPGKKKTTYVPCLRTELPGFRAPCEGSMCIELRSELYAKGALCGSTMHSLI